MELGVLSEHGLMDHHLYYSYTDDFAGNSPSSDADLSFSFDNLGSFDLGLDSPWSFAAPKKETTDLARPPQWTQEVLAPETKPSLLSSDSVNPRGKRRRLDMEKEVVTTTPPSTPPYHVATTPTGLSPVPSPTSSAAPPHAAMLRGNQPVRLDLSREELLGITSDQFEGIVTQVRSNRDLTLNEKREVKKQRRLIKNRESAHASRQRKKDYVSELEKKLADLARENDILTEAMRTVQSENASLRAENQTMKRGRGQPAFIPETITRGVSFLQQQFTIAQQQQMFMHNQALSTQFPQSSGQQAMPVVSMPLFAAASASAMMKGIGSNNKGVLLMVLLFSFGVMFGNMGFTTPDGRDLTNEPIRSAVTSDSRARTIHRLVKREEYQSLSYSHSDIATDIMQMEEEEVFSTRVKERLRKRTTDPLRPSSSSSSSHLASKQPASLQPEKPFDVIPQLNKLDASFFKPRTTYLICENIHKFEPVLPSCGPMMEDGGGSQKLSFLIPPSSLDADGNKDGDGNLLVVTCAVTDVSLLPLARGA